MGPAMDRELIYDLFSNVLQAAELLEVDDDVVGEVRRAVGRLARPRIGKRRPHHGVEPRTTANWSPGTGTWGTCGTCTPVAGSPRKGTPAQAEAARRVLEQRWRHSRRLGQTAWSSVWNALLWCRLREPERAWANLVEMFRIGILPNFFSTEPPMVLDAVFGGCAVVAEMLLQSHGGVLHLLPALPAALDAGRVSGLRARGGFEVAIEWREGSLVAATVTSVRGQPLPGTCGGPRHGSCRGKRRCACRRRRHRGVCDRTGRPYVVVPAGDPVASTEAPPPGRKSLDLRLRA